MQGCLFMIIPKISGAMLEKHLDAIREATAETSFIVTGWKALDDAITCRALFTMPSLITQLGLPPMSEIEIFYDAYYWHRVATELWVRKNGPAGDWEQQGFKMLAYAPDGVEWELMPMIEEQARVDSRWAWLPICALNRRAQSKNLRSNDAMTRLSNLSPRLVKQLQRMSPESLLKVGLVACEQGLAQAMIAHPVVVETVAKLHRGQSLPSGEQASLQELAERWDDEYLTLEDAAEDSPVSTEASVRLFHQARAVAAVVYLADGCSAEQVAEAVYEAHAACDDQERFWLAVNNAVDAILRVVE